MSKRAKYDVIVGNIGTVRADVSKSEALKVFKEYVSQSKDHYGRAAGEDVTIMRNGEIYKEFLGDFGKSGDYAENPARKRKLKPVSGIVHCKRNPVIKRKRKFKTVVSRKRWSEILAKRRAALKQMKRNPSRKLAPMKRYPSIAKSLVKVGRKVAAPNRENNFAPFAVQVMRNGEWHTLGRFFHKANATDYGRALAAKYPHHQFRIYWK